MYKKGEEKIKKELDCVNMMTKLRQLDLLISLYLNRNQKFLLNLQKKHLIQDIDTSEDEGALDHLELGKLVEDTDKYEVIQHHFRQDLHEVISDMQKRPKLSKVDKKVLYGLVTKAPQNIVQKEKERKHKQNLESQMSEQTRQEQPIGQGY